MSALSLASLGMWLGHMLVTTTLLCVLVLAIRKPVARHFGPTAAYALWLLPALRMVLPPLPALFPSLPALLQDMKPFAASLPESSPGTDAVAISDGGAAPVLAPLDAAGSVTPAHDAILTALPSLILILWLAGIAAYLYVQWRTHQRLLQQLRDADVIAMHGRIRIVRSLNIDSPLSLGLMQPMVVLPDDGLLPLTPTERELAIAHEVTHHRRGDLWINAFAVIFSALHWFNPVVRHAWQAFRFDQEAACDAAVLNGADAPTKGAYARALAKAASGHPSAFASPMLGKAMLKERLMMLIAPEHSLLRRRVGLALGGVALCVAMGATASQLAADPVDAPIPDIAAAPAAPVAPAFPAAGSNSVTVTGGGSTESRGDFWMSDARSIARENDNGHHTVRIVRRDGRQYVLRSETALSDREIERRINAADRTALQAVNAGRDAQRAGRDAQRMAIVARRRAAAHNQDWQDAMADAEEARRDAAEAARDAQQNAMESRREALAAAAEAQRAGAEARAEAMRAREDAMRGREEALRGAEEARREGMRAREQALREADQARHEALRDAAVARAEGQRAAAVARADARRAVAEARATNIYGDGVVLGAGVNRVTRNCAADSNGRIPMVITTRSNGHALIIQCSNAVARNRAS